MPLILNLQCPAYFGAAGFHCKNTGNLINFWKKRIEFGFLSSFKGSIDYKDSLSEATPAFHVSPDKPHSALLQLFRPVIIKIIESLLH